jgi:hypothetical protein
VRPGQAVSLPAPARHGEAEGDRALHGALTRSLASLTPRPRCGAFARSTGRPCQAPTTAYGNGKRCRRHGGTGPKTEAARLRMLEGSARGGAVMAARRAAEREARCAG